ncbi:MAG: M28 family peptidase [Bacteroidales bacterium]
MRKLFLFTCILLLSAGIQAQDKNLKKYENTITAADLEKHLKVIASDEFMGRGTGEKGLDLASDYISKEFKGDKLAGPVKNSENPFYQEFELEKKTWTRVTIASGDQNFENLKDFIFFDMPEGVSEYDLVFGGYGLQSEKYNDYKNLDVSGKLVAIMLGEPVGKDGNYLLTGTSTPFLKQDTSLMKRFEQITPKVTPPMMKGAKGFVLIAVSDEDGANIFKQLVKYFGEPQISFPGKTNPRPSVPFIIMSPSQAARLFGSNPADFAKAISDSISIGHSPAGTKSSKIKIEAVKTTETIKTRNVLGYIEGDKKKDELVVICGHFDHEGVKNGEVYNGADDNGSGTVGLIEMAEAFSKAKADKKGPERSLLFIAFTGEEKGLLGSKYYASHPVFTLSNTVTALNIDMLGRVDKEHADDNYIYTIGADYMSSELDQVSKEVAKTYAPNLTIDYTYNAKDHPERLYYRSDQISFAEKGVPVIFYTSGLHPEYHTPKDDVDKIDFKALESRVRLVFATAWELANRKERVKVDK